LCASATESSFNPSCEIRSSEITLADNYQAARKWRNTARDRQRGKPNPRAKSPPPQARVDPEYERQFSRADANLFE
jgi:hypothetical protein